MTRFIRPVVYNVRALCAFGEKRMSLTETCIALAVAGTMMAVSTPSLLQSGETYMLNAAARDVGAELYAARARAVAENRDCRLRVSSTTSYILECGNTPWDVIQRID